MEALYAISAQKIRGLISQLKLIPKTNINSDAHYCLIHIDIKKTYRHFVHKSAVANRAFDTAFDSTDLVDI